MPALAFVLVNHALLARMLWLARGKSVADSGLFGAASLFMDGVLAAIGIVVAFALRNEPWLTPLAALPIVLIQRALAVPSLREQAYKDHKTGLLNSRGLEQAGNEELARAKRFNRSISVLMCDVDGLRLPHRFAVVEDLDRRELIFVRLEQVGERPHETRALGRRRGSPALERPVGGGDRRVDVPLACKRSLGQRPAGGRVHRSEGAFGLDEGTVDIEAERPV